MEEIKEEKEDILTIDELRPVIIDNATRIENRRDFLKEKLLAESMATTHDPKKLKEMIGARSVAEVHRVFNTMVYQKEFQGSLTKMGVDADTLTQTLKEIITRPLGKDSDKIKAIQVVMQSQGIDKFQEDPNSTQNWQDLLLNKIEEEKNYIEGEVAEEEIELYKVNVPELPEFMRKRDVSIEGDHGQAEQEDNSSLKKIYE